MPHLYSKDATRLFYSDEGAGEPFVFVASAWLNSQMWEFQVPYFVNRGFRCIAYDRRGHGRSVYENAAHGLFVTHADRLNGDLLAFTRIGRRDRSSRSEERYVGLWPDR
jgi:non-heme chloroperoxidase